MNVVLDLVECALINFYGCKDSKSLSIFSLVSVVANLLTALQFFH